LTAVSTYYTKYHLKMCTKRAKQRCADIICCIFIILECTALAFSINHVIKTNNNVNSDLIFANSNVSCETLQGISEIIMYPDLRENQPNHRIISTSADKGILEHRCPARNEDMNIWMNDNYLGRTKGKKEHFYDINTRYYDIWDCHNNYKYYMATGSDLIIVINGTKIPVSAFIELQSNGKRETKYYVNRIRSTTNLIFTVRPNNIENIKSFDLYDNKNIKVASYNMNDKYLVQWIIKIFVNDPIDPLVLYSIIGFISGTGNIWGTGTSKNDQCNTNYETAWIGIFIFGILCLFSLWAIYLHIDDLLEQKKRIYESKKNDFMMDDVKV